MADPTDNSSFGKFVPGFEFLQNLARQATAGLTPGVTPSVPQMPSLGNWVAPTFNVEELEKRIQELKAVQFWLDQNSRALSATIQALEVQKMTLATLKGMNFSLGDVAEVLRSNPFGMAMPDMTAGATASAAPAPAASAANGQTGGRHRFEGLEVPERTQAPAPQEQAAPAAAPVPPAAGPSARPASAADGSAAPALDPMQWWGSITQQFQTIASQAMKDVTDQANQMASVVGSVNPIESVLDAVKAGPVKAAASTKTAKPPAKTAKTSVKPASAGPAKASGAVAKKAKAPAPVKAAARATSKATAKPAAKSGNSAGKVKAASPKRAR